MAVAEAPWLTVWLAEPVRVPLASLAKVTL